MLDMHGRPSELLDIEDAYAAFCFDEACAFILKKLQDGEEPVIKDDKEKVISKPSDLYKKYD